MFGSSLRGRMFGSFVAKDAVGVSQASFADAARMLAGSQLSGDGSMSIRGGAPFAPSGDLGMPGTREGAGTR